MATQHTTNRAEKPVTPPEPREAQSHACVRCEALTAIVARLARCSAEAGAWSTTFRAPAGVDVVALIAEAQQVMTATGQGD